MKQKRNVEKYLLKILRNFRCSWREDIPDVLIRSLILMRLRKRRRKWSTTRPIPSESIPKDSRFGCLRAMPIIPITLPSLLKTGILFVINQSGNRWRLKKSSTIPNLAAPVRNTSSSSRRKCSARRGGKSSKSSFPSNSSSDEHSSLSQKARLDNTS